MCMRRDRLNIYLCICYIYTYTYTCTRTHTHTYIHIHTCTHTDIHTYIYSKCVYTCPALEDPSMSDWPRISTEADEAPCFAFRILAILSCHWYRTGVNNSQFKIAWAHVPGTFILWDVSNALQEDNDTCQLGRPLQYRTLVGFVDFPHEAMDPAPTG